MEDRTPSPLNRLLQTLIYFEIVPFSGCLKRILSSFTKKYPQTLNSKSKSSNTVLFGFKDSLEIEVIQSLIKDYSQLKAVVSDIDEARQIFGNDIELIQSQILTPSIMNNVETIIYNPTNQLDLENFLQSLPVTINQNSEQLLFDFSNVTSEIKEIWGALDDVVMGGVSSSNFRLYNNVAVFSGNVSTANNGGFASVRTRNFEPAFDLSDYEGIELRLKGDGKRYKFITRCEGKWDGVGYCYSFDTVYNLPLNIRVPFKDLIPVFRAKTVDSSGSFDSSKIYSLQLMLSKFEYDGQLNPKFEAGFFALEVEYIKAYGGIPKKVQISIVNNQTITNLQEIIENYQKEQGLNINIINR